jgi:short-subunit dehydrogenase
MKNRQIILGARSGIGRELSKVRALVPETELTLCGRDVEELERDAADLRIRYGVPVVVEPFDARDFDSHKTFWEKVSAFEGELGVIGCFGTMPPQDLAQKDFSALRETVETNLLGMMSILSLAANTLEERKSGFICALSSVAGDRGRAKNYIYGAAKAGLSAFMQGLCQRLSRVGVKVILVKPGVVDTGMTWGVAEGGAEAGSVAKAISKAIDKGKYTVYTPWKWRMIMAIVKSLPTGMFNKTKF